MRNSVREDRNVSSGRCNQNLVKIPVDSDGRHTSTGGVPEKLGGGGRVWMIFLLEHYLRKELEQ